MSSQPLSSRKVMLNLPEDVVVLLKNVRRDDEVQRPRDLNKNEQETDDNSLECSLYLHIEDICSRKLVVFL